MTRADFEALMTEEWCARLLDEAREASGNAFAAAVNSEEPAWFCQQFARAAAIETVRSFILQTLPIDEETES
jgi:hypothetical protein